MEDLGQTRGQKGKRTYVKSQVGQVGDASCHHIDLEEKISKLEVEAAP
jgi:hypothetical protein